MALWNCPVVTLAQTRAEEELPSWVCACAEELGAGYYGWHHNRTDKEDTPLLISFEASLRDVIVDGRDFLYTLFQFGEPERAARPVARQLFGAGIDRYLQRAWSTENQNERIALCDLAVQDDAVVEAHASNVIIIGGRHKTRFRNAFLARLPVPPERILGVRRLETSPKVPVPQISLDDIRRSVFAKSR
jgi:hypothetical protein